MSNANHSVRQMWCSSSLAHFLSFFSLSLPVYSRQTVLFEINYLIDWNDWNIYASTVRHKNNAVLLQKDDAFLRSSSRFYFTENGSVTSPSIDWNCNKWPTFFHSHDNSHVVHAVSITRCPLHGRGRIKTVEVQPRDEWNETPGGITSAASTSCYRVRHWARQPFRSPFAKHPATGMKGSAATSRL